MSLEACLVNFMSERSKILSSLSAWNFDFIASLSAWIEYFSSLPAERKSIQTFTCDRTAILAVYLQEERQSSSLPAAEQQLAVYLQGN